MSSFEASAHSYGAEEAATKTDWGAKLTALVQQPSTQLNAWNAVVSALSDPRERVAVLKAKIKNYKAMKAKYGIGPVADLYQNEIVKMRARLGAEEENLRLQEEGEESSTTWRWIGHTGGYVGIGLGLLAGGLLIAKIMQTVQPRAA